MDKQVIARCAIESLRSGVPNRYAVAQLGTTQNHIKEAFEKRIVSLSNGAPVDPLIVSANFGAGKSHLLNYLKTIAADTGCITSFVTVSPETPLGNTTTVLNAITEVAEAPGRTGRALQAIAADANVDSDAFAEIIAWAKQSSIHPRFAALLHLYRELKGDEEFRHRILRDFEGAPITISVIRQKLKELDLSSEYVVCPLRKTARSRTTEYR
jgi:P-loop Domain of unknown function (DUF2791)